MALSLHSNLQRYRSATSLSMPGRQHGALRDHQPWASSETTSAQHPHTRLLHNSHSHHGRCLQRSLCWQLKKSLGRKPGTEQGGKAQELLFENRAAHVLLLCSFRLRGCLVSLQNFFTPSHRMFRHMHGVLNVDKKN
jgi:hypothetical protein